MKKLCVLFLLFVAQQLYAQSPTLPPMGTEITKAIPPSADAAALGKYGRVPVSYFTGVPEISVPLYTIKSGDLSLPVSLSYHSGGIKVEEQASSVGLGWVLNAGGAITRTVRGIADEDLNGYLDPAQYVKNVNAALTGGSSTMTYDDAGKLLNHFVDGTYDGEADIFNYNFGGYSGQFSFTETGSIIVSPRQDISFTFPYSEGTAIASFIATTPDGVKWYFGGTGATEYTQHNTPPNKTYATGWFLTKVVSPSGSEIDFTYKSQTYTQAQPGGTMYRLISTLGSPTGTTRTDDFSGSSSGMQAVLLTGITFENGNIQVFANLNRLDINPSNVPTGAKMIDSISINSTGMSKLYRLYYTNKTNTRLRLDSLTGQLEPIVGTAAYKKERYSFNYNTDPWSPTGGNFVNAQDWWGYFNGYLGNTTIVPIMPDPLNSAVNLPGGERKPDIGSMAGGVLNKITYPAGGSTVFTFEPNMESGYDFGSDSYIPDAQTTAFSDDNASVYYNYDTRNGNPTHLMHVYSTVNPTVQLPIHLIAYGLKPAPPVNNKVFAWIKGQDGSGNYTVNTYLLTNTDTTIYVNQGYYQIQLSDPIGQTVDSTAADFVRYSVAAIWANRIADPSAVGHVASGLRIEQIADYDGISITPYNVKTYKYVMDDGTSSGYLCYQPQFAYNLTVLGGDNSNPSNSVYYTRAAFSNYPLATQHGAVVGYLKVSEYIDGNGQKGKNDYYYTIAGAEGVLGPGFPFAPPTTMDWKVGLMVRQVNSKYTGSGNYAPLQQKVLAYTSINTGSALSIKAGFNPYPYNYIPTVNYVGGCCSTGTLGTLGTMLEQPYTNATDYTYMSSDTTWVYDAQDPTKWVKTWNNYQYDPTTYQLTRLQSLNSKNELITQSVTYPGSASLSVKGVSNLFGLNIFTYPIEEVTTKSNADGSNTRTVKAVLTSYKANKPYRDTVFLFRNIQPVTNFVKLVSGGSRDTRYQAVVSFDKYDAYGSIMQAKKIADAAHSYIWGYPSPNAPFNNTYPIAEVINADSTNIAYTNFESYKTNGLGNWVYNSAGAATDATAPMGAGCYTVSSTNTLVKSGLTSATSYVVSFWAKSGAAVMVTGGTVVNVATGNAKSGWTYYEYSVTAATSVTIGGSGSIDEVRLYPSTAEMSTYTYIPLVGMSAKCDVKNDITYFNFDNVGRLIQVLDQNRNVVKQYQYNYKNSDH